MFPANICRLGRFEPKGKSVLCCLMDSNGQQDPPGAISLSEREEQVAQCVATGLNNKEIADNLSITEQTVKNHLNRVFHKIGAKDRLEVALWVISQDQDLRSLQ